MDEEKIEISYRESRLIELSKREGNQLETDALSKDRDLYRLGMTREELAEVRLRTAKQREWMERLGRRFLAPYLGDPIDVKSYVEEAPSNSSSS